MGTTQDKLISVTDFRKQMQAVLDDCTTKGQRYQLLCHNSLAAILVSPAEWMMITETLAILEDRDVLEQIKGSDSDIQEGDTRPAEDIFKELDGMGTDEQPDDQ